MKNLLIFNLSCMCTCQEHGEDGFVQQEDDYDPSHEDVLIIIKCTADFLNDDLCFPSVSVLVG